MFFKAAKRPSAPAATPASAAAPAGPSTVESLGQQLREALPARRLHSLTLCDHEANVLWLSEGALGPDEHLLVTEALAVLSADTTLPCHEMGLEDGRFAIFLPVRAASGAPVGIAMILADRKSVGEDTLERLLAAPVHAIVQRLATLLHPEETPEAPNGKDAIPVLNLEMEEEQDALPSIGALRIPVVQPAASQPPGAAPGAVITPRQIDAILEYEAETPRPAPAPAQGTAANGAANFDGDMVELDFALPPTRGAAARAMTATQPPAPPAAPELAIVTSEPAPPPDEAALAPQPPARSVPVKEAVAAAPASEPAIPPPVAAEPAPTPPSVARFTARAAATRPVAEAVVTPPAPGADPNLVLELLPLVKLRAGGQTRRFQLLARAATAHRDPAAFDALVLQRLLGWLAAHRAAWNSQPTSFTVSLSIPTLEDERFAQKVAAALNAHGIAPENLGFEIPESVCTQRRAQVERFLTQCDKIGCWVVVEDFSFDSQVLPLLRSKALRLVKIDARLSSSALKDKLSQALVVATVQAAKVLGIHCAAKKVDSQAALQWLTAIGCDFAQGAALAAAQPLEALASSPDPTGISAMAPPIT